MSNKKSLRSSIRIASAFPLFSFANYTSAHRNTLPTCLEPSRTSKMRVSQVTLIALSSVALSTFASPVAQFLPTSNDVVTDAPMKSTVLSTEAPVFTIQTSVCKIHVHMHQLLIQAYVYVSRCRVTLPTLRLPRSAQEDKTQDIL